jgi:predicted ester cyclase
MSEQADNKRCLAELLAAVDAGDIERALAFYSPEYYDHDSSEARGGAGSALGVLRGAFTLFYRAFTDTRHSLDDLLAEGDRVAARISVVARHTGEILGIAASGKVIRNDSIVIYRFENGRIRERWCRERHSTRALLTEAASTRAGVL